MSSSEIVTVLVIGETGDGKSENGNAFLQKRLFEVNSKPYSSTFQTSAQSNIVDGITRYYIDTQGLEGADSLGGTHAWQMVSFLKDWKIGVNAFLIVINIQYPRVDHTIKKLLILFNDFFNNPSLWNQTGIVFTKCYGKNYDKTTAETKYRNELIDFIKKMLGCSHLNPQMPCFFVDSVRWQTDESTKLEYIKLFEFAHKNPPIPTNFKKIEPIIKKKILIRSKFEGDGPDMKKINFYEDQKILKYTEWNGNESYSEPEIINSYTEEIETKVDEEIQKKYQVDSKINGSGENEKQIDNIMKNNTNIEKTEILNSYTDEKKAIVKEETKVEKEEIRQEHFKTVKVGKDHWKKNSCKEQVHDYFEVTTKYKTFKRKIIFDANNKPSYGEWVEVDTRVETRKEK